jgi:hypothetical protein
MNLVPNDCMLCTWSDGKCQRLDLTGDAPQMVECPRECCINGQEDDSPQRLPLWAFAILVILLALVVISTVALVR